MKRPGNWFEINLVYGLEVIVPLAVLALLIAKLAELPQTIALSLKLQSSLSAGFAIARPLLLLVYLGIGTVVPTKIGSWSFKKLEQAILQRMPGYERRADGVPALCASVAGGKPAYRRARSRRLSRGKHRRRGELPLPVGDRLTESSR